MTTTTEVKHTPGPWRWEFNSTAGNEFLVHGDANNGDFAYCNTPADKALQAAAPDLLESLEALLFVVMKAYQRLPDDSPEQDYWMFAYIEPARDAIRKATGSP